MNRKNHLLPFSMVLTLLSGCLTGGQSDSTGQSSDPAVRLAGQTANSVFEIVALKPYDSPETAAKKKEQGRESEIVADLFEYEKPLDWQNLDFTTRNDEYIPLGTAFAISETELVTAAHVLSIQAPTYYGRLFIRNPKGEVFELDTITRYSHRRDFACFTVKGSPRFSPLPVQRNYVLNEKVYTVGNALGKGIIYREGLLTSTEKEGESGAWSFLLFSAPASPGNSGGPLLNAAGEVVGIVLSRTENENLNYSLPVSEWIDASRDTADLGSRTAYRFINTSRKYGPVEHKKTLPLPMAYGRFREEFTAWTIEYCNDMIDGFYTEHGNEFFPNGDRAAELFQYVGGYTSLCLIGEKDDNSWDIYSPGNLKSVKLGRTGKLIAGSQGDFLAGELIVPDGTSLSDLYADPELVSELFLKGYPLFRYIGSEPFRVTRFGPVLENRIHVDKYGRKWIRSVWAVPFADSVLMLYALPTPEGFAFIGYLGNVGDALTDLTLDIEFYCDFALFSYKGTLQKWKEYLARKKYLPQVFEDLVLEYTPGQTMTLESDLYRLSVDGNLVAVTDTSHLVLDVSFVPDEKGARLEPVGISYLEYKDYGTVLVIKRVLFPPEYLPETYTDEWMKVVRRSSPFNRERVVNEGYTTIMDIDPVIRDREIGQRRNSPSLYLLSLGMEGDIPAEKIESRLTILENSLIIKEKRD